LNKNQLLPYKSFINGTVPELNGMRCYAVLLVLLHHIHSDSDIIMNWFKVYGWYGVNFFFTLSGFLITGLLLKEINQNSSIDLKAFWMRRIFRLWPAFYTCLFFGSLVILFVTTKRPEVRQEFYETLFFYPLALANYLEIYIRKDGFPLVLNHFWSLAVEEHFYLLWPILFSQFYKRKVFFWLSTVVLLIIPIYFRFLYIGSGETKIQIFKTLFSTETNIDSMLYGCIAALFYSRYNILKNILLKNIFQITSLALLIFTFHSLGPRENLGHLLTIEPILLSLASCLFILGAIENSNKLNNFFLKNRIALYIGKISYSLYLTHHILYTFNYGILSKFHLTSINSYFIGFIQISTSILASHFLFHYIESPFLKMRKKFTRVH